MKRRRIIGIIFVGVVLLGSWIFTLGIAVDNSATYYPEGIAEVDGVSFFFDVDNRERNAGIPYLFMYSYDRLPYDVSVTATSPDLRLKSIHIQSVDVKFADYTHFVTTAVDAGGLFSPIMRGIRSRDPESGEISYSDSPATRVQLHFPELLTRRQSVTLRFNCFLFFDDGTSKKVVFERHLPIRDNMRTDSFRKLIGLGSV